MSPFYIDSFPGHDEIQAVNEKRSALNRRGGITAREVIEKTVVLLDIVGRRF